MQKVISAFRTVVHRKWVMGVATLVIFGMIVAGGFVLQPSFSAGAASGCSFYTVRWGDTLGNIALRYHSNVQVIARTNHIWNPNLIFPGQRFCIPASHGSSPTGGSGTSKPTSVTSMIYSVFGPYAPAAISVAKCESDLNPRAYNPISIRGNHSIGIFQILYPSTWMGTPQAANSPYDPMANILAAHSIFVRDGYSWREWVCKPW
jgi:LysM repeat protein